MAQPSPLSPDAQPPPVAPHSADAPHSPDAREPIASSGAEPEPLAKLLLRSPPSPLAVAWLGLQLMRALAEMHRGGRAHGELDLDSVQVLAGAAEQDRRIFLASPRGRVVAENWLAPERRGPFAQASSQTADLWAAGCILQECLARSDDSAVGVDTHLHPPRARGAPRAPRAIEQLCARLTRQDPLDRYQSAHAAAEDLQDVVDALANGARDPLVPLGRRDRRQTLTEPSLVGRGLELEKLEAALSRAGERAGSVIALEAPSGGGKSFLLDELQRRAARGGALVLRGQGVQLGPPRPYQLFAEAVDALAQRCASDAKFREPLAERLRESLPALASMFPALGRALDSRNPDQPLENPPESQLDAQAEPLRGRRPAALVALVEALGAPGTPALLVLDDAQWCDEDSREAIRLLAEPTRAGLCTLVVLGVRTDAATDATSDSPAASDANSLEAPKLPVRLHLRLPPLQGLELPSLLESMAGPLPLRALEAIEPVAGGNPLFATAALRALVECGALVPESDGWRFDVASHERARLSSEASVLLLQRLAGLPTRLFRLVSAGAVLGKIFSTRLAARLVDEPLVQATELFLEAKRRGLLLGAESATVTPSPFSAFAHDRFREAVLAQLPRDERRALHGRAGRALEEEKGARAFDLAHHFAEAGEHSRALPHALRAIDEARAQNAFDLLEQSCRIAQSGLDASDREGQRRIALSLAEVLTLRGRLTEAAAELSRARTLTVDNEALARLDQQEGELAFRCNDYASAERALEAALARLGEQVPRTRVERLFAFAGELFKHSLFQIVPSLRQVLPSMRRPAPSERRRMIVRLLHRLSHVHHMRSGLSSLLWSLVRENNLAEQIGPSPELVLALSNQAAALAQMPFPQRARRVIDRARALAAQVGDPLSSAYADGTDSLLYGWEGRFDEAISLGRRAQQRLEELDDRLGCFAVCTGVATWLYRRGALREALAQFEQLRRIAPEVSRRFPNPLAMETLSRALLGYAPIAPDDPAATREIEASRSEATFKASGMRLLVLGRPAEAAPIFGQLVELSRKHELRSEAICAVQCWYATALRLAAEREQPLAPERRELAMRLADREARRALKAARSFQINLPHALREAALTAAQLGRARRSRNLLAESIAIAVAQGARLEDGLSRLAQARLGLAHREPGAAQALTRAHDSLRALGVVQRDPGSRESNAPLRPEQVEQLLAASREIAAAATLPSLFTTIESTSRTVLPGLQIFFRALPSASPTTPIEGLAFATPESEGERLLVSNARRGGGPALSFDAPTGSSSEAWAILCAPVLIGGRAVACILASGSASALAGEQCIPLAGLLASVAGAVLEKVIARERLAHSERDLRQQVDTTTRAREQERRRLALALHDGAGQTLSAAGIHLAELIERAGETPLGDRLEDVRALLFATLDDVRSLAHDLHASAAEQHGLLRALDELVSTSSSTELSVSLRCDCDRALLPLGDVSVALFRIAQAALGNVIAHARARRAVVELQLREGQLHLSIEDDGIGFNPDALRSRSGIGIVGMRERVQLLGGTLHIRSRPGEGTCISIEVPAPAN